MILQRLRAPETKVIVYDSETSGLNWRRVYPVGHVFTFGPKSDESFYVPIRHAGGGNIEFGAVGGPGQESDMPYVVPHPFEVALAKIAAERTDLRWVMHNAAFDLKIVSRVEIKFTGPVEDTMVNQSLVDENMASYSLEACCRFMGVQEKKGDALYKYLGEQFGNVGEGGSRNMANFWRTAGDNFFVVDYATGDGTSTWQLLEAQRVRLQSEGLERVHAVECRCIKPLDRMTRRGIKVDEAQLARVTAWAARRKAETEKKLPKDFNVRSPIMVKKFLEDSGVDLDTAPRTAKGALSFTEKFLATIEPGRLIIAKRKMEHLNDSFLAPLIERHLHKGRVHPDFNQSRSDDFGTVTGRLSSSNPNMQQIHKKNREMGAIFRSIFVPDEGMIWGSADYSQMEPRLLAHYSKCQVLLEGYNADPPVDAHQAVATAAGIDRERGKRINQTMLTGGGVRKIASELNLSEGEARTILNQYFAQMPEIKFLQKQATGVMKNRRYVMSLLGRRARLTDRRFAYRAVNRLLQGGNADILKLKMANIDEEFEKQDDIVNLLTNTHDAFEFQFPPGHRALYEWALAEMCRFPDADISLNVSIAVETDEGPNWAVATYGSEAEIYIREAA
jgi:DNA polymerase-1